jgi:hypothetical protein
VFVEVSSFSWLLQMCIQLLSLTINLAKKSGSEMWGNILFCEQTFYCVCTLIIKVQDEVDGKIL